MKKLPITGFKAAREYLNFVRDPVAAMRSMHERYGPIVALGPAPVGGTNRPHVLAIGPEFNRQVLGDPATFRPTGLLLRGPKDSAQRRVRFGLTRMTGAQHKEQRQLVMPAFHSTAVRTYHDQMVGVVSEIVEGLRPGRHEILAVLRLLTLRAASTIHFSHDPAEALPLGQMLQQWVLRNFSPAVRLFPLNFPGTPFHDYLRLAERIERKILELIAKRRAKPGTYNDVLALLIEARDEEGSRMTDTELVGQTAVLFSASMETTSTAMMWTLFLLAQHPAVMNDVMNELDTVLKGGVPTPEQLRQLRLLNFVIKESMRVLAPVPYTVRSTTSTVSIGPYRVPDGTRVVCSHFLTHHLPELYPEPNRFRPERWNSIDPNQYEYLPFSAGPRVCIGAAFATQLMLISLAMMLQKFRFSVVPGTRIDRIVRITMQPRGGLPMLVCPNDRNFAASKVHGQIHEMVDLP